MITQGPEPVIRIAGLGGIGQVVAIYVTRYLASLGEPARVVLIDGDVYEPKNETRMKCPEYDNKAVALQAELAAEHETAPLSIVAVPEYLKPDTIGRLIPSGVAESVFLCVDNHATRKLVADHVATLADVCLVSGGNDGVGRDSGGIERPGTAGNVQVHVRRDGTDRSAPLTKFHPEIANPSDDLPGVQSCGAAIAAGTSAQLIFSNVTAAAGMMNAWHTWRHRGSLDYCEVVFDIALGKMTPALLGGVAGEAG